MNLPPKPEHLDVHIDSDVIVVQINGTFDESIAHYLGAIQDELALQFGYTLVLQYCRSTMTLTPEARRRYFEWNKTRKYPGAIAFVGANFTTKTLILLVSRAVKLLVTIPGEIKFFDSEAPARLWLDEQRSIMKKTPASSSSHHD